MLAIPARPAVLRSAIATLVRRSPVLIALFLLVLAGCQQGSGCDVVKVSQVPLEARGQLFAVPLTLGNHTLSMLLDTGAQRSMLDEATVRRLKIPQDGRTFTVMVGMAGGSPRADANVEGVLLGDAPLSVSWMPVSTAGGLARVRRRTRPRRSTRIRSEHRRTQPYAGAISRSPVRAGGSAVGRSGDFDRWNRHANRLAAHAA